MFAKYKSIVVVLATIAALDLACFVGMIAKPDWTERGIPALAGIQILGFIVLGFVWWNREVDQSESRETQQAPSGFVTRFLPWVFGFVAMLLVMQAGLGAIAVIGQGGNTGSFAGPFWSVVGAILMVYLIVRIRKRATRGASQSGG